MNRTTKTTPLLLLLALAPVAVAQEEVEARALEIVRTFTGDCYLAASEEDPLDFRGESIVADDADGWRRLLGRIPDTEIHPSERIPNEDPILEAKIDFEKHRVVFFSRAASMTPPEVVEVFVEGEEVVVAYRLPPSDPAAHPISRGAYTAIVIPKTEGEVVLAEVDDEDDGGDDGDDG